MVSKQQRYGKYYKFLLYLVVVVLINLVGLSLFFRFDLTSNRIYSLSQASKDAVGKLSEPLTINVFFTKDLPAPHNNTERYLHDLLEEYAANSNRYFNYRFYDVSAEEGDISEEAKENQQMAKNYGIYPVQIQNIEQDEVKFKNAYMGMVLIHGDVVDKIPSITSTEGLEYTITSKIEKMNNKISVLLNLEEPVRIKLYFSSSLEEVAPQLRIGNMMSVPGSVESVVTRLNDKYYDKLSYSRFDPSGDPSLQEEAARYNILTLRWPAMSDKQGNQVLSEGQASAGLVVQKGEDFQTIPIIQVVRLPLFGTQYQLADMNQMEERLSEIINDVIDINKKIGYLADHGTAPLGGGPLPNQMQQGDNLSNFNSLVSEDYSISPVNLKEEGIPEGIDCLIMAGPKEEFNDYELFQIDQFLMKGKSLALFLDPYQEISPSPNQARMNYNQQPVYLPINTGLEKLLSHYGVEAKKAYVLDKNCFEQRMPQMYGGGKQAIYFAPIIKNENINKELPFLDNIKALIAILSAPVELKKDRLTANELKGDLLFSSSRESWEMSGRINLNPMFMQPPERLDEMQSQPLAVLVSGEFPSYFAGREIPEKPAEEEPEGENAGEEAVNAEGSDAADIPPEDKMAAVDQSSAITGEGAVISRGKPGKLFVIGSAEILKNNVLGEGSGSTNATFVMNLIDHLNGRNEYAAMRSKMQRLNPLKDSGPGTKMFIKSFNIAGLPVIVALFGIIVWFRRESRKKIIQMMFKN
ncbi:MAG: GldG family protein [Candidatus Krumholzibacteriota bacterium]|nr:GldG family protein [Candidatus Krumholzibacteriota bacterium]